MRILADENITLVREHFAPFGEVVTVSGRDIKPALVRDCDALLVRSITNVNAELLAGSRCRFVGTATSGIDHIDVPALDNAGIRLGWALGCNAISVVDYVFSALAALPLASDWRSRSFGIIGCGQIGTALAKRLLSLGHTIKIYDPLLPATHELARHFASFNEALRQQVITFHVPLTRDGAWPTHHMLTERALDSIGKDAVLFNAARGAIVDNALLLQWLQKRPQQQVVLDAWEHEPAVALELLRRVNLGTPHIAGYSQEGKLQGTLMVLKDFCNYFGFAETRISATPSARIRLETIVTQDEELQLNQLLLAAYDVRADHSRMQRLLESTTPAADFDGLRKHYPVRHEFSRFSVSAHQLLPSVQKTAAVLGFEIVDQS